MNPLSYLYKAGFCDDIINIIYDYVFNGMDEKELLIRYSNTLTDTLLEHYYEIVHQDMKYNNPIFTQNFKFLCETPRRKEYYYLVKDLIKQQEYCRTEIKKTYTRQRQILFRKYRRMFNKIK